jgi:hypothetical protein
MFSLGGEGLNIGPPRVALPTVFTCLLVCVLYSDNCRGYESFKGSSELTPCDICDHIYRVKSFTIVSDISRYGGLTSLQCCTFIITSHHLRRCFVFYGGHTSKWSNVFTRFFNESVATFSPTIHPSVYISMVHHDNIYVFSFSIGYLCVGMYHLVYVCMYVYTWRSVIFSLFRMKTLTTLSFWRQRKYGSFEWKK